MSAGRNPVTVAVIGIGVIVAVLLAAFTLPEVLRGGTTYRAEFTEAAGLQAGDLVTVAGVEAGRVGSVELDGDHVLVAFTVTDAWVGDRTTASIEVKTLLGAKYLALDPQGDADLDPAAVIPRDRTASPFDVVDAFNGLSATIDALDTDRLAASLTTLSDTFRGTAPEVRGALEGLSRLSRTIASRDEEIRRLLGGTRDLSAVLDERGGELEQLLRDGNLLLDEVQRRKDAISALLDGTRALSEQLRGLVADNSAELRPTLESLDRVAAILERNRDALAAGLRDEAPFVRLFNNAVGNGRWFDNYICGLVFPPLGPVNEGAADVGLTLADKRQLQVTALASVVAVLLASALFLIVRPSGRQVTAYFTSAVAAFEDNAVRVLGVPVGTIDRVTPEGTRVRVDMTIDDPDLRLPADVNAVVVSPSLVTGRYVQLTPTWSVGPELADGAVIPVDRTAVPLDVDDLARTASELAAALGPDGANADGALSDVLDVGAANLDGNGRALNDTITDLGELSGTLADSREELFGTVRELQGFTSVLAANDAEVREFTARLADVTGFLADERGDLGAALQELSIALGEVAVFVEDNRAALRSSVDRLTEVTEVLVDQQRALAETLDVAPAALGNLANAYNGSSGTLDTRANINELTLPPIVLICELLERGNPLPDAPVVPEAVGETCSGLGGVLDGTVPLPSAADVITSLQAGETPQVPGLTLPGPGAEEDE